MSASSDYAKRLACRKAFFARLERFLEQPNPAGSDWPDIPGDEWDEGLALVRELVNLKWGRDVDDSSPVRVLMYDRQHATLPWELPLHSLSSTEKLPWPQQETQLLRNLSLAASGVRAYADAIDHAQRLLDAHRRRQEARSVSRPYWRVVWRSRAENWRKHFTFYLDAATAAADAEREGLQRAGTAREVWVCPGWRERLEGFFDDFEERIVRPQLALDRREFEGGYGEAHAERPTTAGLDA